MSSRCRELANEILQYALAHNLTLSTAESCSAGSLGKLLATCAGASKVFQGA
jgi:nicotinamide mononucleotide (NMN) deamidase PncC